MTSSVRRGCQVLPDTLARKLGEGVRLCSAVTGIAKAAQGGMYGRIGRDAYTCRGCADRAGMGVEWAVGLVCDAQ